jgi:hypothetical protein
MRSEVQIRIDEGRTEQDCFKYWESKISVFHG